MTAHEAVAECIKAAGFDAMAREYLKGDQEKRQRVVRAMTRNIANDKRLGPDKAAHFAALAQKVDQ